MSKEHLISRQLESSRNRIYFVDILTRIKLITQPLIKLNHNFHLRNSALFWILKYIKLPMSILTAIGLFLKFERKCHDIMCAGIFITQFLYRNLPLSWRRVYSVSFVHKKNKMFPNLMKLISRQSSFRSAQLLRFNSELAGQIRPRPKGNFPSYSRSNVSN